MLVLLHCVCGVFLLGLETLGQGGGAQERWCVRVCVCVGGSFCKRYGQGAGCCIRDSHGMCCGSPTSATVPLAIYQDTICQCNHLG